MFLTSPHEIVDMLTTSRSIEDSIRTDLAILKASPLIKKTTQIVGLAYDVETGLLRAVDEKENRL